MNDINAPAGESILTDFLVPTLAVFMFANFDCGCSYNYYYIL